MSYGTEKETSSACAAAVLPVHARLAARARGRRPR
jgi:hypothetical protein